MRDNTYNLIRKGLDVSSLRKDLSATNIANINTPDYKIKRVEFEEELNRYNDKTINLSRTHGKHYNLDGLKPKVVEKDGTYVKDNGNNVDIDVEMAELAANELYFSTLIRQVNAKLGSLNYVVNNS